MRSRERDRLLGPPGSPDGVERPWSGSKLLIGVLLTVILMLGVSVALLLGRPTTAPQDSAGISRSVPAVAPPPMKGQAPTRVRAKPQPPEPALSLAPVTAADWNRLGIGCVCAFSRGRRSKELFIAGGDDLAIWRPAGDRKVCPLREEQLQELFDDDARIECGSSRVVIRGYGKTMPGFDGHSRQAKLTVYEGGEELLLDGHWGCGC